MPAFTPPVAPPSRATETPPPGAVRIRYGPAPQHFGDLRLPGGGGGGAGSRPLVVIIHGGAYRNVFHVDLMDDLADDLTRRGFGLAARSILARFGPASLRSRRPDPGTSSTGARATRAHSGPASSRTWPPPPTAPWPSPQSTASTSGAC